MSRTRHLVAAGVIRAGRRYDIVPTGGCRPVLGQNFLDTPLGVAGGTRPEAIQRARWMLAGARAGHAAEAEQTAATGRAAAAAVAAAGPVGSGTAVRGWSGVAR